VSDDRSVFDATASQATRDKRQQLGQQVMLAISSLLRNARSYSDDNAVFNPVLDAIQHAIFALLESDGTFELELIDDGVYLNRQALQFDAMNLPLVTAVRAELRKRGILGFQAVAAPPRTDLRGLVRLLSPKGPPRPGARGDPAHPFGALRLKTNEQGPGEDVAADRSARLVAAYAHAVFFVDHTIQQLRVAGELIPLWAASRVVQDLVDMHRLMPRRFLQLARTKVDSDEYWGYHAANVAVLAISFGARLGLPKSRRHDLGMAALFHDVGMAAIPAALLDKQGRLDARAQTALKASPLFAARAILRDREVHPAALERALAAYECHLDLITPAGEPLPEIGLAGRILSICESYDALTTDRPFRRAKTHAQALRVMTTEQIFRFDPELIDLLPMVVEPLLEPAPAVKAPAGSMP
jgi:HD-GYP domain-containing protein (c-di-GMP phosphodiesterase class II)